MKKFLLLILLSINSLVCAFSQITLDTTKTSTSSVQIKVYDNTKDLDLYLEKVSKSNYNLYKDVTGLNLVLEFIGNTYDLSILQTNVATINDTTYIIQEVSILNNSDTLFTYYHNGISLLRIYNGIGSLKTLYKTIQDKSSFKNEQGFFFLDQITLEFSNLSNLNLSYVVDSANMLPPTVVPVEEYYDINLYPNPVRDILYLKTTSDININRIDVINSLGVVVATYKDVLSDNINVEDLESGNYFLKIYTNDNLYIKKFLKVNI